MAQYQSPHTFHIPVMGIGFTIDTPIRVAPFGISSVISLVDDQLMEKMRKYYCQKENLPYEPITEKNEDFRAKRITSYLDLVYDLVETVFQQVKESELEPGSPLEKYYQLLPYHSPLYRETNSLLRKGFKTEATALLRSQVVPGSIDVNLMTRIDRTNHRGQEKLPVIYNDGHAAVRGFAQSKLKSSLVLSAGINLRIFGYLSHFADFLPGSDAELAKKVILKVSDYRSAVIQSNFLAKKGIWVSEYRIESGLNCGGHVFPTQGLVMGPILQKFLDYKEQLLEDNWKVLTRALTSLGHPLPSKRPSSRIVAQGGIGTHEEHEFLLQTYKVDSVGWATPFLFAPDVTNVDPVTLKLLQEAGEEDLEVSDISPLGLPFNSLRRNTKDIEKRKYIAENRPGSPCTKKYAALHEDTSGRTTCSASREFQRLRIKELDDLQLTSDVFEKRLHSIISKSCICVGLGTSALLVNELDTSEEGPGVSICPGPNAAYFSKITNLEEMAGHIYGKTTLPIAPDRPAFFIKELSMYVDFLKDSRMSLSMGVPAEMSQYFTLFKKNLLEGIAYYRHLMDGPATFFKDKADRILDQLCTLQSEIQSIDLT